MKKQTKLAKMPIETASEDVVTHLLERGYQNAIMAVTSTMEKSEVLVVYLFIRTEIGEIHAKTRTFIDHTNYITQDLESQELKFLTATVENLLRNYTSRYQRTYISLKTKQVVGEFFGERCHWENPIDQIQSHQSSLLTQKRETKDNAIKAAVDRNMEYFGEVPADFETWVEESALFKSRYLYYQYTGKVMVTGYCTHCKQEVDVRKPKHNQEIGCPSCGSKVILKTISRSTQIQDGTFVTLLEPSTEHHYLLERTFEVFKKYGKEYQNPKLTISEVHRTIYSGVKREQHFSYGFYKNRYAPMRWNDTYESKDVNAVLYPYNLMLCADLPQVKYSGALELATSAPDFKFRIKTLLRMTIQGSREVEKLAKVGLYRLAHEHLEIKSGYIYKHSAINVEASTLNQMLQVEHDDAKLLIAADVNMEELFLFQTLRQTQKRLTIAELKLLRKMKMTRHLLMGKSGISSMVPVTKALRYLDTIYQDTKKIYSRTYHDYLNMCRELEMDLTSKKVAFPNNLVEKHDVLVDILNEINKKQQADVLAKQYAKIEARSLEIERHYGYQDKDFLIRAARSAIEIFEEGTALSHCVGSRHYLTGVADGEIAILFLRHCDQPEKPFYTIEMRQNKLIQCKSFGNQWVEDVAVKRFLKQWQGELERRSKCKSA